MKNIKPVFGLSMRHPMGLLLVLSAICLCPGCSRKAAPPIAKAPKKETAIVEEKAKSASTENKEAANKEETAIIEDKESSTESSDRGDSSTADAADNSPDKKYASERMVLFAPGGPIVIEWMLSIDGRPYQQALEQLIDKVLKMADADEDGRSTWDELTNDRRVIYGQFGNLAIENERSRRQVVKLYDIDRDKLVDRDELPRFLTRNAGGSKSFSLRNTRDYLDRNRTESNLRKLLDVDANGILSAEEIQEARVRLQSRDVDDNDIIVAADFIPFTVSPQQMNRRRRSSGPESAALLGSRTDWNMFVYSLEERYAIGGSFEEESFPLFPAMLKQLDADEDGALDNEEAKGLENFEPHIQLSVDFGLRDEKPDAGPKIQLVSICQELKDSVREITEQEGRVVLELPAVEIEFFVNDSARAGQFKNQVDRQFPVFDTDKNGYVEKQESEDVGRPFLGRFEAVDGDGDGKIYPEEAVDYLSRQQATIRGQIRARAGDQSDALFAALDSNNDGRLTSREIEGVTNRLLQFDVNEDGEVSIDEIPSAISVGLARGNPQQRDQLFIVSPQPARSADEKIPRWFVLMDSNGDGDISAREFLGDGEQFRQLDANGDSFLDAGEIIPKSEASSEDSSVDAKEPQTADAKAP